MKKFLSLIIALGFIATQNVSARTGFAVSNSNWNNNSTWMINGLNSLPTCGDTLTIPAGKTVTINSQENYTSCGQGLTIYVEGTLQLTNGVKLILPCNSCVNILNGGVLKKSTRGGGSSSLLEICKATVWRSSDGPINTVKSFCNRPLPISLLRFEGKVQSDRVDLSWTTASEINNDVFILERSSDGTEFSEVTKVNGAGNSTEINEYQTADYFPLSGITYYRLKQVDFDGQFSYSDLIATYTKVKNPFDFISVETTVNSTIWLTFSTNTNEVCNFQVLDLSGVPVFNMYMNVNAGLNKKEIYCPFLKKGIYILSISNDERTLSKKISLLD